ncbi:MAG: ATP-binding protein, partial [Porticoccaceae bacterium]
DSFSTSGKQGGTGLGLAYCKRTMLAFGGNIHCESELGEYSNFILSFPEAWPKKTKSLLSIG